jgi:peroxiredoxin
MWRIEPYLHVYNVEVGDRAPGFELTTDDGQQLRLGDYKGKWVLVNFWASWCPPCVQETPSLNQLQEEFRDKGLVVIGISEDESKEAYDQFLDRFGIRFRTVRDTSKAVKIRYGTQLIPDSYLISPDGEVVRKYVGAENWMRPEVLNDFRSLL